MDIKNRMLSAYINAAPYIAAVVIAATDSPQQADYVLGKIEDACLGLYELPERGVYPKELLDLGIRDYREVIFKPCRIICRLQGERAYVYLIADGRRDMQSLLQRRLLSG